MKTDLIATVGLLIAFPRAISTMILAANYGRRHSKSPFAVELGRRQPTALLIRSGLDEMPTTDACLSLVRGKQQPHHRRMLQKSTILRGRSWPFIVGGLAAAFLRPNSVSAVSTINANIGVVGSVPTNPVFLATTTLLAMHAWGGSIVKFMGLVLCNAAAWYTIQINARPIITKSATAAVIAMIGDYLAQRIDHRMVQSAQDAVNSHHANKQKAKSAREWLSIHGKYDVRRALSMAANALFISGPLMHYGYSLFEQCLPIQSSSGIPSSLAAFIHAMSDSIFLDAIFVATTLVSTGIMEGYSRRQVFQQLRNDYQPSMKASWAAGLLVMPIEILCFRYLPLEFRVLGVNFIDVVWDSVISFMAHRSRHNNNNNHMDAITSVPQPSRSPELSEYAAVATTSQ